MDVEDDADGVDWSKRRRVVLNLVVAVLPIWVGELGIVIQVVRDDRGRISVHDGCVVVVVVVVVTCGRGILIWNACPTATILQLSSRSNDRTSTNSHEYHTPRWFDIVVTEWMIVFDEWSTTPQQSNHLSCKKKSRDSITGSNIASNQYPTSWRYRVNASVHVSSERLWHASPASHIPGLISSNCGGGNCIRSIKKISSRRRDTHASGGAFRDVQILFVSTK